MDMEYELLLKDANKGLSKVVEYIKQNKEMFDYMDLKLHDVSYYYYTEMEKDFPLTYESDKDIFYTFCEDSYDTMVEMLNEAHFIDFDKMRHQVGRTSKFYLHNWYDKDIDFMLYNILSDISVWWYTDYINIYNGVVSADENEEKEAIEPLEYLATDFYKDFMDAIEDIKIVYNYIKDFKDNQVGYFKDYVQDNEEYLQYEKEQIEKENNKNKNIALDIKSKYNITDEDFNTLSKTICYC